MNTHHFMESDDVQDFGEVMERFLDVEFEYEKCHPWHDSDHTKTTVATFMSDDCDEDLDEMIDAEDEPTFVIDTHSFDPPIPFRRDFFTTRQRSREWSTLSREDNDLPFASFFDDPIDIHEMSIGLDPPSQTPIYNYSVFDHNCCEMAPALLNSPEPVEIPSPTPFNLPTFRSPQELSYRCGEMKLNGRSKVRRPSLVGDLNFDSFHVSRPVSSIHFLGKLSSPIEHPLADRVKSGLRKPKGMTNDMMQCTSKKQDNDAMHCRSTKQTNDAIRMTLSDDNSFAKVASGLGQKRCRRIEPLEKEYVEITDNDVLLGRGGLSNRHPGNIVYRQHILEHQREYKLLKTDAKTEMSMEVVAWVKKRGGRFLKRDENAPGQPYYIATDVTARQKVSQALREDHTPEGRQQKKSRTKAYQS